MVTETTTEYKEATDDSGFSDFGSGFPTNSFSSGFPQLQKAKESSSSSSSSEDEDEETGRAKFEEEALKAHNEYRAKHGVAPLKLDKKVVLNDFQARSFMHFFIIIVMLLRPRMGQQVGKGGLI